MFGILTFGILELGQKSVAAASRRRRTQKAFQLFLFPFFPTLQPGLPDFT
jgi:hypothetical protein